MKGTDMSASAVKVRDLIAGSSIDMPDVLTVDDILEAAGTTIADRAVMVEGRRVTDASTQVAAGVEVILAPKPMNG